LRLVIGYPPGGSAGITARLIGHWLSELLGQPVVIESRPGAGTNIATETVVNAPPDGYTLLLVAPANAINAISGQGQVMCDNGPTSIEFIRAGKLRPLAVTTAARSHVLPDLPTVADFVPGYEASAWYGLGVPKGTPKAIVDRLNTEINGILADPKAKARFAELGASLIAGSPAEFGQLVADETEKWAKVVKFSGARPD